MEYLSNWNPEAKFIVAFIAVVVVIATAAVLRKWGPGNDVLSGRPKKLRLVSIAHIEERIDVTVGGALCFIMLVLTQIGIFMSYNSATTVLQQAVIAALWIGGNTLWGIGVIVGRRKQYTVYRSESAPLD